MAQPTPDAGWPLSRAWPSVSGLDMRWGRAGSGGDAEVMSRQLALVIPVTAVRTRHSAAKSSRLPPRPPVPAARPGGRLWGQPPAQMGTSGGDTRSPAASAGWRGCSSWQSRDPLIPPSPGAGCAVSLSPAPAGDSCWPPWLPAISRRLRLARGSPCTRGPSAGTQGPQNPGSGWLSLGH